MVALKSTALAALALLLACSGLEPSYRQCAVSCGTDGMCPAGYVCAADDYCHPEDELPVAACTGSNDASHPDASSPDADPPDADPPDADPPDADPPDAAPGTCDLGTATNAAAVVDPTLFAQIVSFANGDVLAAGRYRIDYVDGCNKYAPALWWSVHGRESGDVNWWLINANTREQLVLLPGTTGLLPGTAGATGERNGFEQFDVCVAANKLVAPLLYDHTGGPLGIVQTDISYDDNVSGDNGRNPTWRLTYLGPCADIGR